MRLNRHSGLALLLIFFGALILLNKFGFHTGHVMSYVFPVAIAGLGWLGIKNGRSVIGWILLVFGGLLLLGKLSGLIAIAVAIGFICYGVTLLKNKSGGAY
ncbi:hypothetical protein N0M98_16595 [Paenibacillus doosanensis]|uniref:LiaF transmembrane domain-containing protein n=1 Tax=Paenibacillus konkukensis TaxID=2020716 RepID=A0ABY4RNM7_9BACL|nr:MULTISPECIES: hypothetical protein [Paenibacillus]MCS7461775.1 hypothetical protein [Paenibacillus doosanensis]UQZ83615.1 hypothetical protein SK3146_02802 [Paenibacillus konkukensis]